MPQLSTASTPTIQTNLDYADTLAESNENKLSSAEPLSFESALQNWIYVERSNLKPPSTISPDQRNWDYADALNEPTEKKLSDLKTTTSKSWVQDSDNYYDNAHLVDSVVEQTTKTDSKKAEHWWMNVRPTTIKSWVQDYDNQYDDANMVDPIVEQTTKTVSKDPQSFWLRTPLKLFNNAKARVVKVANDIKSTAKDLKSKVLNFGVTTTKEPLKPRGFYWTNYKKPDFNTDEARPIIYNPNELDDPLDYSQGNQPHRFTRSTNDEQMTQDLQQSVEPFGQFSSQSSMDLMQHNYQSSSSIGGLGHASIGLGQQDQQKANALREFQDFQLSFGEKTTQRPRYQTNLNIQMGSSRGLDQHSQDQNLETDLGQQVVQQESSFDQQSSQDFLSQHGNKPTQRPRYQTGMNFQIGNSHGFEDQQSQNLHQNVDLSQQSETSFGAQQESSFDQQSSHQVLNHGHGHGHHESFRHHHHSGDGPYPHHSAHSSNLGFGPSYDRYEPSQSHSIYTSESRTHTLGSNVGSSSQLNHNLDQSEDLQQQTQDFETGSSGLYSHSDLNQQSQHNLGVNANKQFSLTKPLTHTLDKISDLQQQLGHFGQSTYIIQQNSGSRQSTPSTFSQSTLDQSQAEDFHLSSGLSNNRFKPYHSSHTEQNYQLFGGVTQSTNVRGGLSQTKPTVSSYDSSDSQVALRENEGFQSQVSQQSEDFHLSSSNRKPEYGSITLPTISPVDDTQQQTQDFQITGQSTNQELLSTGNLELSSNQRTISNRPGLDLQQNPEDFQISQFSNSRYNQQTSQTFQQPEDYQISLQSGSHYRQSSQPNPNYQQPEDYHLSLDYTTRNPRLRASRPQGFDDQSYNSQQQVHDFQLAMSQTSEGHLDDSQRTSQAILQQSNARREDLSQQSSQSILQQSHKAHSREIVEESSNSYLQPSDKKQVGGRLQTPFLNTNVNVTVEENHTGFWSGLGGKVKDNLNKAKDNVVKAKDTVKDTIGGFLG